MINIESFLEKYYSNDDKIILACSTGADSMFLLYKILETKFAKNLVVCYFNHKTRVETDSEEVFIEELGKKEGFEVEIASCDFEKIQKLYPSKSFEELAREKRYSFFNAIMNIYESKFVLTAHHLDDKLETFLFNLSRGSKITGLINMTENSGNILRPLLNLEKNEILNYLETNNLKFMLDSTNEEIKYTRNYTRHEILPKFERLNKNYKSNINNTLKYFEDLKDFIDNQIVQFLGDNKFFDISEYNNLLPFMQKELIRYIYYVSNGNSTIGLSESNIMEVNKFINGKNNKTIKEIRNMKLSKDNKIIRF